MLDELSIDNLAGVTGGSRQDLFAMMMMSQMQSTATMMATKVNNDASMLGLLSSMFSVMHGGAPIAPPAPPGYPVAYAAAPYPAAPYAAAPAAPAAPVAAPIAPAV